MKSFIIGCAALLVLPIFSNAQLSGLKWVNIPDQKIHELHYKNRLLTAYRYDDSIMKPVLYPLNTVSGTTVTRGFPIAPRQGDRTDHPHHVGLWLNYESVNGLDFWNNSTAIPFEKRASYGSIFHQEILKQEARGDQAILVVLTLWKNKAGELQLKEKTEFLFTVIGDQWQVQRSTTLTAADKQVIFKDVKDGMLAIRVARELEQPSKEASSFVDANGIVTKVDQLPAENITGLYTSSEGLTGDAVWSSRARWVMLNGKIKAAPVTVAMMDHPSNIGYPTYWHARGYGLFALNPLGAAIFSNGKESRNQVLEPGQSIQFKYKIVIQGGKNLSAAEMNRLADKFAN
ncbi:PmoA family protein [Flavihumibacter sp. RY-1]|uniref:PmoA family protein n=1 Tax=Flavihumibacter fluminis TaxID=2909236 RepID=A0ABS9BHE3_9BACT|nr:PmoA family protein [Flavihumibacter fluminis]MCF1715124.1 PmoA family protein [Flavihumibacter fluminis]